MSENLLLTALTPHPPIMIPEVGRTETTKVEKTIQGMKELSQQIVDLNPETIIVVTPHSYLTPYYFSIYTDEVLYGDFTGFGAPEAKVTFKNDLQFIESLTSRGFDHSTTLNKIPSDTSLDHGSAVPLYYIAKAGYQGKILVINYTNLGKQEHIYFGEILRKNIDYLKRKTVFIASGDLSHRLLPSAPAGYNPEAKLFDNLIIDSVTQGNYELIIELDPILRKKAGECAYNSLMVAMGIINRKPEHNKVFSYEAPFGVGYAVATL